jgi:hypothetical protein
MPPLSIVAVSTLVAPTGIVPGYILSDIQFLSKIPRSTGLGLPYWID